MYIAFPIAWMYYFGTNLDARFHVPDFWPNQAQSHKIPTEREEREELMGQLKERRENMLREARGKRETGGADAAGLGQGG